jgi:hypothetical protein
LISKQRGVEAIFSNLLALGAQAFGQSCLKYNPCVDEFQIICPGRRNPFAWLARKRQKAKGKRRLAVGSGQWAVGSGRIEIP